MKKIILLLTFLFGFSVFFADEVQDNFYPLPQSLFNVRQYTLENGLQVFILEDSSTPLITVNFCVKAGFSDQNQSNSGFFKLYSRILQKISSPDFFDDVQCNADSTRFSFKTTSSQLENKLNTLSTVIFDANFGDEILSSELESMKKEVTENSSNSAFLINAAIDSKVFSSAPWKQDSGIYPSVFNKNTDKTARTILKEISDKYYTPQNSAIFISGNLNSQKTLQIIKNLFGKFYSSYRPYKNQKSENLNAQKKFVIHNSDFSKELTQVVVQYTNFNIEETDVFAQALNNSYSSFKQNILALPSLNIPGDEYINVAAAHKTDSSRLIFQTLMQPQENTNSLQQTETFTAQILQIPQNFNSDELDYAKYFLIKEINSICASTTSLMDKLCDFWTIQEYSNLQNNQNDFLLNFKESDSPLINDFLTHFQKIYLVEQNQFFEKFNNETPYIFVIISDSDYKKNAENYKNAGYEEINSKNSSWYVQKMYENIKNQFNLDDENYSVTYNSANSDSDFVLKNKSEIKKIELSNKIPVIYKKNPLNTGVTILINVSGGKFKTSNDPGFEEVMLNILANLIQREIYEKQTQGIIFDSVNVSSNAENYNGHIIIECSSDDFAEVCRTSASALIFGNIPPASADRAVNSRQYKKRLENGSAVSQMYSAAINTIFPDSPLAEICNTDKEILQNTNYTKILQSYPEFLDADRYTIIIAGNFDENELPVLEECFGQLENNSENQKSDDFELKMNFPKNKTQKIKITHTFLTDIPAEKAGPMPSVLIPTTEFLDPVIYFIKSPETQKETAIFNATLNYVGKILQNQISENKRISSSKVQVQNAQKGISAGCIIIQNVAHTKEIDSEYKNTIKIVKDNLNSLNAEKTIQEIKDLWIKNYLADSDSNTGTAELIIKGFEESPNTPQPDFYLTELNEIISSTPKAFQNIMQYFPSRPDYRLYSSDSKN